ncbi:hypothetical protein [uncultured Clostridium sp.]|uniref:hypothetical protein n=1 Tax=uncultured Clostridium sp. TaxID=59620 RepID=UPI00261E497F|nr:hypothetical protein [uncultured Clostridium sp.]
MKKIAIAVMIACVCASFISCGNKKSTEVVTIDNGRTLTKTDSEVKTISSGDYISREEKKENYYNGETLILKDRVINSSENGGLDIIYDDGKTDYIEPQNEEFSIVEYISNGKYLVWIEADAKNLGTGAEKLNKEYIYSRNIETGEFVQIASLDYSKLEDYQSGLSGLDISENNNLIYKYYKLDNSGEVEEKVILYNLDKTFQKEIIKDNDEDISLENMKVGLNNVIYIKSERDHQSREITKQTLINYQIDDGILEEIDLGLEVKNLDIYDKEVVFISEGERDNLELYIYDLESAQLTGRIFEDSNLNKYYEKLESELDYDAGNLHVDESYIYMLGENSVVYDLKNKKFIVLENDMVATNYDYIYSHKVGYKKVLVTALKGETKVVTEYTLK